MKGIYKIENTETGFCYIGRSFDIEKRWQRHKLDLIGGTHPAYKLQEAYTALKDKNKMTYEILEIVNEATDLPAREQYYYDKYDSYFHGYNGCQYADNPKYKKHSFVFYEMWYEYIDYIRKNKNEDYACELCIDLCKYGLYGAEKSNNPNIFGNMCPDFIKWLTENHKALEYEKWELDINCSHISRNFLFYESWIEMIATLEQTSDPHFKNKLALSIIEYGITGKVSETDIILNGFIRGACKEIIMHDKKKRIQRYLQQLRQNELTQQND